MTDSFLTAQTVTQKTNELLKMEDRLMVDKLERNLLQLSHMMSERCPCNYHTWHQRGASVPCNYKKYRCKNCQGQHNFICIFLRHCWGIHLIGLLLYCCFQLQQVHKVTQFQVINWDQYGIALNRDAVINIINAVSTSQSTAEEVAPIVVHCRYLHLTHYSVINIGIVLQRVY